MALDAVVFDMGETIVDDTEFWAGWARWFGVRPHTVSALVGAVTAQGMDNAEALRFFRPDLDIEDERRARVEAGQGEQIEECDLYEDVREACAALRANGVWLGVVGNQTERAGEQLKALALPVDAIATSQEWKVAKPDPRFFRKLRQWVPAGRGPVAYVGDHRDDVLGARGAGLVAVHLRRGPFGHQYARDPQVREAATWCIDSLLELPGLAAAYTGA